MLRIATAEVPPPACRWNGKAAAFVSSTANGQKVQSLTLPMQAGETALLSLTPTIPATFTFEWLPAR